MLTQALYGTGSVVDLLEVAFIGRYCGRPQDGAGSPSLERFWVRQLFFKSRAPSANTRAWISQACSSSVRRRRLPGRRVLRRFRARRPRSHRRALDPLHPTQSSNSRCLARHTPENLTEPVRDTQDVWSIFYDDLLDDLRSKMLRCDNNPTSFDAATQRQDPRIFSLTTIKSRRHKLTRRNHELTRQQERGFWRKFQGLHHFVNDGTRTHLAATHADGKNAHLRDKHRAPTYRASRIPGEMWLNVVRSCGVASALGPSRGLYLSAPHTASWTMCVSTLGS